MSLMIEPNQKQFSDPSDKASASAAMVLFTIHLIFLEFHESGAYLPFSPTMNIIPPPCDPPFFRFAREASLNETSQAFSTCPML